MRGFVAAAALVLALAGCARTAPPAPVIQGRLVSEAMRDRPDSVVVQPGETLYGIARRWHVPVRSLIELNDLRPPYHLLAGTRLALPQLRVHTVAPGETLYGVARRHGLDVNSLARTNQLSPPYTIVPGEMLLLPEPPAVAARPPVPAPRPPTRPADRGQGTATAQAPAPASESRAASAQPSQPRPAPPAGPVTAVPAPSGSKPVPAPVGKPKLVEVSPPPEPPPPPKARAGRGFVWPVKGKILSGFGPGAGGTYNDGINIAAPAGTPVLAVEDGVVAYAGNELRGYGNLVLLKHPNGWMSAYAHCERILVKKGARVRRGQTIARVGATGAVSEPQLHFELRRGTRAIDPLQQLPPVARS
jgi:murein DD-endopeptidase MepM/ murein hydrolase activator NlpD